MESDYIMWFLGAEENKSPFLLTDFILPLYDSLKTSPSYARSAGTFDYFRVGM